MDRCVRGACKVNRNQMKKQLLIATLLLGAGGAAKGQGFTITGLAPARNTVGVTRATNVTITLSQPVGTSAGTLNALKVYSSQRGGQVAGTTTVSGNTLTFDPRRDFKPGEVLRATLTSQVQSTNGATLTTPQVLQFGAAVQGGNGRFSVVAGEIAVGTAPSSLAAGDIDGDGDLDLVAANAGSVALPGNTVSIRLNNGRGVYAVPAAGAEIPVGTSPQHVVLADVDGDGDLDLLTANQGSNTVSLRLNNGVGSFSAPATGAEIVISAAVGVALGDLDADGDLDLVAVSGTMSATVAGTASVLFNNGSGLFSASTGGGQLTLGYGSFIPVLGDIDNDGDLDLVVPNDGVSQGSSGSVSVRINNGQGSFSTVANRDVLSLYGADEAALGDIDGDGDLDLMVVNFRGRTSTVPGHTVSVRVNNGGGFFSVPSVGAEVALGDEPRSLALGDVDGDGDLDMVVAGTAPSSFATNTVDVRVNIGLNSGSLTTTSAIGADMVLVGDGPRCVVMGDVDGDGDIDFLTANQRSNNVSIRLNNGTGAALAAVVRSEPALIAAYPNPATGQVTLSLPPAVTRIELFDALGRCVPAPVSMIAAGAALLDVTGLVPGLYRLRAVAGAEQVYAYSTLMVE